MNCRICGKELSDGRRKICKECAEKEKKEKEEMKAKKAVDKKNQEEPKKVEEVTEEKNETSNIKKNCKKTGTIAIIAIVVLLIICLAIGTSLSRKGVGNTIGNVRNYGYATINGNYIYYLSPNDDSSAVGIFKIKKDGTGNPKELFMEDLDIVSINVYNGYVYFIGISSEAYSEEDEVNNKIYRMKTNGDNLTVINDNEFNNDCYEIYVVNGYVYYIGTDNNIYKMSLNGGNRSLVSDTATGYLGITEKYIVYNVETTEDADYITYIMNIDGTNQRPILDGERLYSVNIDDDYVYYTNVDKQICRTKIDSGESEIILDVTAYNMNLNGKYIYFLNYKDIENEDYTVCLYKIKADGSEEEPTNIKELDTYSSFIDVVGDWVIYMDSNETEGFLNLVKTDGSDEVCVYKLDYEEYYNSLSGSYDYEDVESTEETETPEDTTTPEDATTAEGVTQDETDSAVDSSTVQ